MKTAGPSREIMNWWAVVAALTLATPWPAVRAPDWLVLVGGLVLFALARPSGRRLWPWLAFPLAWGAMLLPSPSAPDSEVLARTLDRRCGRILEIAESVAADPYVRGLVAGAGETLDPGLPFRWLDRAVGGEKDLSIFLADERGQVVAWGGSDFRYPTGMRPLGPRSWSIVWTAGKAMLVLREPLLSEGRLVGALTVMERAALISDGAFGLRAPPGRLLMLGDNAPVATSIQAESASGVEFRAGWISREVGWMLFPAWLPWGVVSLAAFFSAPLVGFGAIAIGFLAAFGGSAPSAWELSILLLLAGACLGRWIGELRPPAARVTILAVAGVTVLAGFFVRGTWVSSWLPDHIFDPGTGVAWLVAVAWVASGWPVAKWRLENRLLTGFLIAFLAVLLSGVRPVIDLARVSPVADQRAPPAGDLNLESILPASPEDSDLGDLAPVLAERWDLDRVPTGSELLVRDRDGAIISSWGDLGPAWARTETAGTWSLGWENAATVEWNVAQEPWSLLEDWPLRGGLDSVREAPIWWVVLTRSGTVAASLHPDVQALEPEVAGNLYHKGGGWVGLEIGGALHPAKIHREGAWLVAKIARWPSPASWAIRGLLAVLWVIVALFVARPPELTGDRLTTFGGRLRLLVTGGVVLPLAILTGVLQLRLAHQERETERMLGAEAFRSARYTAEHMAGGFAVNDDLARWIAGGWGGEVALFEGVRQVASSRPDLVNMGVLPELPLAEAFPLFLLGRDDIVVRPFGRELVVSGAVELEGRRHLLQLTREASRWGENVPTAIDWLLGGALVAALLALVAAGKVERRLSHSLREVVGLSRRLLNGESLGEVPRPPEKDLAEVIGAVQTMSRSVQERESLLRDQEEMLRITLSTLEPAVFVLDDAGRVLFANPSAEGMETSHSEGIRDKVLRGLIAENGVETIRPEPGKDLTWQVGVAEVPLPGGRVGRVIVIEDLSEVVRAERLEHLTHMARIVAHEVKNPLTPIRLWVQELEEARRRGDVDLGDLVGEATGEILVQMERLQATANDFSNLVALEGWEPQLVDLSKVVEEAVRHLVVLRRRGVEVLIESAPEGEVMVVVDPDWLRRAVDTLLLNSVTVIDQEQGRIVVRTKTEGHERFLEVEDDGGGVSSERLDDLFAPHFSTTGSGTGLGLALVRQIVVRAHGEVDAFNGERGLLVRLRFPAPSKISFD
ncbi:MAG: PAS domain-containing sensor histidine kinase [Thermoanaerobaculales bacterium]|nr:PAS domain-containing sensor histidine kinase [Thermoanaerobaculales bacterium]